MQKRKHWLRHEIRGTWRKNTESSQEGIKARGTEATSISETFLLDSSVWQGRGQGKARQGKARQGEARLGQARQGKHAVSPSVSPAAWRLPPRQACFSGGPDPRKASSCRNPPALAPVVEEESNKKTHKKMGQEKHKKKRTKKIHQRKNTGNACSTS